jgi:hypothetical protein
MTRRTRAGRTRLEAALWRAAGERLEPIPMQRTEATKVDYAAIVAKQREAMERLQAAKREAGA